MKKLAGFLILVFGISSCHTLSDIQIEKRRYRKGYYVHIRPHRYTEPIDIIRPEPVAAIVEREEPLDKREDDQTQIQSSGRSIEPVSQSAAPPVSAAPQVNNNAERSVQRQVPMRSISHE